MDFIGSEYDSDVPGADAEIEFGKGLKMHVGQMIPVLLTTNTLSILGIGLNKNPILSSSIKILDS